MHVGLLGNQKSGFICESIEIFQLHEHSRILRQRVCMCVQVIPIEGSERAGFVAGRFSGVEFAAFAMVAHSVDVFTAGHIGLAGHQAAISKLAHAQCVG